MVGCISMKLLSFIIELRPAIGCSRKRFFVLCRRLPSYGPAWAELRIQVHWRTPDRFVTPATDIEQDPPPNMLPADPPQITPNTPPSSPRSPEKPLAPCATVKLPPLPDESNDAPEDAGTACPPDRCEPLMRDYCWEPVAGQWKHELNGCCGSAKEIMFRRW